MNADAERDSGLENLLRAATPAGFVLLWSTGFIGAKLGLPYADSMTFLTLRFAVAAALLGLWCWAMRAALPARAQWPALAVVGGLNHGVYLGCVFTAIGMGLNAGIAALVAGLSPIMTALIAGGLGWEKISAKRWLGMALGFGGVVLAVARRIEPGDAASWAPGLLCVLAAAALALGAILQRRWLVRTPLAGGNLVQYASAGLLSTLGMLAMTAFGLELRLEPTGEFLFALGWLVLVLSLGAISLLYLLLRWGEASGVASLMFLTPGAAAAIAWPLFGETLGLTELAGFALAAVGVALATQPPRG